MTFPTPHPVQQQVFTGGGQDILGNDIEVGPAAGGARHLLPVLSRRIGQRLQQPRRIRHGHGGAAWVPVTVRDRFLLPGDDKPYEVTAIEDANHGVDATFTPGSIVKLKRVTGGG